MQKTYSLPLHKSVVFTLLLLLLIGFVTGCSKSYDAPFDPLAQNILYITGNREAVNWKLVSLTMGGIPEDLKLKGIDYNKKYFRNGTFTDSDGMKGKWFFVSKDSLVERYTSLSGIIEVQGYRVTGISNTVLSLDYLSNRKHVCTTYAIAP